MLWWKKHFLIEGTMYSNNMFVTMSCLSEYKLLSPCKESNDAAATSSFLLKTNGEYVSCNITISWTFLKYQNFNKTLRCLFWKKCKRSTKWELVPLWPNIIPTTVLKHHTVTKTPRSLPLKIQGINPMILIEAQLLSVYPMKFASNISFFLWLDSGVVFFNLPA